MEPTRPISRLHVALAIALTMAACQSPTSPVSPEMEAILDAEYSIAQQRTYAFFGDHRILNLPRDVFQVREVAPVATTDSGDPYFYCGDTRASGCYHAGGRIEWLVPEVLRHEYGHGILERLRLQSGGCGWREWEHIDACP